MADAVPDSPIQLAARLNDFTPRSSAVVLPHPASAPPEPAPSEEPSFRERVRQRSGRADLLVFIVGAERFALPLAGVEEAVEVDAVHPVPEAGECTIGLVDLRGRMVPLLSPARAVGVAPGSIASMLVLRDGTRRVGIAVDDVDDVLAVDLGTLHAPPDPDAVDGVLLALARHGDALVGLLDPAALLAACHPEPRTPETAA